MNIGSLGIQNGSIQQLADQGGPQRVAKQPAGESEDFAHTLMDVLKEVNAGQQNATQVTNDFMTGRHSVDIHDLEIALQRANIAMNLTMSVRNKMLEAYQEISRMQV
jgi:flagellar hook-basal body complex protein FliE